MFKNILLSSSVFNTPLGGKLWNKRNILLTFSQQFAFSKIVFSISIFLVAIFIPQNANIAFLTQIEWVALTTMTIYSCIEILSVCLFV